jgi:hypothetical protein
MHRRLRGLIAAVSLVVCLAVMQRAEARTLMDFFKAVGNSIAHPQQKKSQAHKTSSKRSAHKNVAAAASPAAISRASATPIPGPSAAPSNQLNVRTASAAPEAKGAKRDVPYAVPVPGMQGVVTSPFAPQAGYVDVRKFPPGTEVKDPFSGKIFRTP